MPPSAFRRFSHFTPNTHGALRVNFEFLDFSNFQLYLTLTGRGPTIVGLGSGLKGFYDLGPLGGLRSHARSEKGKKKKKKRQK